MKWVLLRLIVVMTFLSPYLLPPLGIVSARDISSINSLEGDYQIYLPIIIHITEIPEVASSPCLWSYTGISFPITYKWGSGLSLDPNSLWRQAFEYGFSQWNNTSIKPYFVNDPNSPTIVETYDDGTVLNRGLTSYRCVGTSSDNMVPVDVVIGGNIYYDIRDSYTVAERKGVATHEVGHGIMIDHIPDNFPLPALMSEIIYLWEFDNIYSPQYSDIALINQKYP